MLSQSVRVIVFGGFPLLCESSRSVSRLRAIRQDLYRIADWHKPLAAEHDQPALGSRSTGRLAALQLGMIINPHCHESGNDRTAGHQVAKGNAFSVCHWEVLG